MPPPDKAPQFLPKLRNSTEVTMYGAVRDAFERLIRNVRHYPFKTCLNCKHFNEQLELCNKFKSRPPARVIAFGCPAHEDIDDLEDIPF